MSARDEDTDDDYHIPLVDQRVFGAGVKRKRIAFVPAASAESSIPPPSSSKTINAGDRYLSIVLKKAPSTQLGADKKEQAEPNHEATKLVPTLCPVCGQVNNEAEPDGKSHESSIAHQICLEHSHPPSHLDRSHIGLKYLQDYGWDPNARTGLGARSEGIRIPIKAKEKNDSTGLGMGVDEEEQADKLKVRKKMKPEETVARMNAKQVREMEMKKSKRAERLRADVYGPDLSQYLEPNG